MAALPLLRKENARKKKRINSRQKGAAGERELANYLKEHGYSARRGQQFSGGADSPDVVGLPGYHIECKRTEKTDLYGWMAQAYRDCGQGTIPIVVHRKSRGRWLVILDFEQFLNLDLMRAL